MCGFSHGGTAKLAGEWADVAVWAMSGQVAPVELVLAGVGAVCAGVRCLWWVGEGAGDFAPVRQAVELKLPRFDGERLGVSFGDGCLGDPLVC